MNLLKKYSGALWVFLISFALLSFIQVKFDNPMILLERFIKYGGWIEILVLSAAGAFLFCKMQDKSKTARWRTLSWAIFSIMFFTQLVFGLLGFEKFLMTGDLHLPVPAMIIGGSIFRLKIAFMPVLFLSTIILSGPAWCSQLCYFGAIDNLGSKITKRGKNKLKYLMQIKILLLVLFLSCVIMLKAFNVSVENAAISGAIFGLIGLLVIFILSPFKSKMIHCIYYCPVGTIVNLIKFINPFRMYIDEHCTDCQKCSRFCKYAALQKENITNRKPGITCTYCGDCLQSCHTDSIKYKLFNLSPQRARNVYLIITISIFIVFMGVARI